MVEQPRRVASRMATWLREGWCRHAIFNLKLPMKQRWAETGLCLELLRREAGVPLEVRARQLFHDREEITLFVRQGGGERTVRRHDGRIAAHSGGVGGN